MIEKDYIIMILLLIMIILFIFVHRVRKISNIVLFDDKLRTYLDKPLKIKDYEKLSRYYFKPYPLEVASDINKQIFELFSKTMEEIIENKFNQKGNLKIIFLDKIDGYIEEYDEFFLLMNLIDSYYIRNEEQMNIVKEFIRLPYIHIEEVAIDGIYKINKTHFLRDLSYIEIINNMVGFKEVSTIIFNFKGIIETKTFSSFELAFDFLFTNEESDIRLIQKIANSAILEYTIEED